MKKINLITVLTTACMLSATVSILGVNNYAFAARGAGKDALLEEDEGWITHKELGKIEPRDLNYIASIFPEGTKIHGIKYRKRGGKEISSFDIHFTHISPNGFPEDRVLTIGRNLRYGKRLFSPIKTRQPKWVISHSISEMDNRSHVDPKHRFISTGNSIKPDRTKVEPSNPGPDVGVRIGRLWP